MNTQHQDLVALIRKTAAAVEGQHSFRELTSPREIPAVDSVLLHKAGSIDPELLGAAAALDPEHPVRTFDELHLYLLRKE